jgi:hypothetical protein
MFQKWDDACLSGVSKVPKLTCLPFVFQNVVAAALSLVGIMSLFFIVYAGIKFATSGGDAKNIGEARKIMTYAILGVIIVLSSFAIIFFIAYATNAQCITKFGFGCK